jgi:RHS repeat-associated protein
MTYDWADNVLSENRNHNPGAAGATGSFSIANAYTYEHAGRRNNFLTTIGGIGQHVAEYNYNHRDELVEKNLHANQVAGAWGWLQSIDYSYNAQGWLSGINNWNASATVNTPALCTPAMPNPSSPSRSTYNETSDLFMLDLRYDQPYTGIAGLTAAPAQKTGNISQIVYRARGREASIVSYSYDYLSRLSTSTFHNYSDAGVISGTNNYNESLTYDLRGNIQTLQRTGYYTNGSTCTYGQIDNLTYSYTANTNRLHKVLDGTVTAGDAKSHGFNGNLSTIDNSMTYDRNGNLNKNLHKNVSTITYNHLNLPTLITFTTGNTIEFLYDAAGTKLRKTVKVGATVQYVQDYLPGGIEYRQTGTGVKRVESVFHAEGRYYNTNVDASNTIAWRKEYNFKDHLGNTRLVFTDRNANGVVDITGTAGTSDVLQENHYYSFGMAFEGPWLQNDATARDNKYQYNGKELNDDFGLNWNDYGARWYDAGIGRWNAVDPLAEKMSSWSSFNYVFDNPTRLTDPTGMAPFDNHFIGRDGSIKSVQTNDSNDQFYVQYGDGSYRHYATLEKNGEGLVKFPDSGDGFNRYGTVDKGGEDPVKKETRGEGDHYIKPGAAAALFGLSAELADSGIKIAYGDMSSSNGSDPGTGSGKHHSGHGHLGKREGLDVDFRYITKDGESFKDGQRGPYNSKTKTVNDMASPNFSLSKNQKVYDLANKYGFTKNYQGSSGLINQVKVVKGHDDHGHLGLTYSNLNWQYVPSFNGTRNQ